MKVKSAILWAVVAGLPVPSFGAAPTCAGQRATIVGTDGADKIVGTDGDDVIVGLRGNDKIDAGAGNDTVCSGAGKEDDVNGGAGDDVLRDAGDGFSRAEGGDGNDQFVGFRVAFGGLGDDTIKPGSLKDRAIYYGQAGNDVIVGSDYHDEENLGDDLYGGPGDDVLRGRDGGRDFLHPGPGKDTLDGGPGLYGDVASYADLSFPVMVNLTLGIAMGADVYGTSGAGVGVSDTLVNIEHVEGTMFADHIIGDDDGNHLDGCAGGDYIEGRGGHDSLTGIAGLVGSDGTLFDGFYSDYCSEGGRLLLQDELPDFVTNTPYGVFSELTLVGEMVLDGGPGIDLCRSPNIRLNCEAG